MSFHLVREGGGGGTSEQLSLGLRVVKPRCMGLLSFFRSLDLPTTPLCVGYHLMWRFGYPSCEVLYHLISIHFFVGVSRSLANDCEGNTAQ